MPTTAPKHVSPLEGVPTTYVDDQWGRAVLWPLGARARGVLWLVGIFCAYVGAVLLYKPLAPDGVALLWLPNAVLVTAMLKFRPRDWPYVYAVGLLAEVVGDLTINVAPHQAAYFGVVNAVEATLFVLCAALIAGGRRNIGLLSLRGACAVILAAVMVPALTGALGAIGSVWTFDADYLTAWRSWWFGDGLGLLVGVPIGLLLHHAIQSVARRRPRRLALGGTGVAALVGVLSAILAAAGYAWEAQQIAIATAVLLSFSFGALGAPLGAVLMATVTLIGLAQQEDGLTYVVRDQTLLFVVFAAVYIIAAAAESADRAMGQLSRTGSDLESLLEATPDALIIVGPDGRITFANAQTDQIFGYSRDELVGSEVEMLLPARFRGKHIHNRRDFFAEPTARPMGAGLELWGLRCDGAEFPVSISLSPLQTGQSLRVLAAIRDVTERHEYEQQLHRQHGDLIKAHEELDRLARFDSLTGLVNRAEVLARLETALTCSRTPGTELGVLFCDIDRFKTINDTYGHSVGDAVLWTVADRISQCVRHGDSVGRTGGDEILVLLPGLHSLNEATQIAEKIQARNAEPIQHSGETFHATLSIGATLAIPGESVTEMTARADGAMYLAKRAGGNTVRSSKGTGPGQREAPPSQISPNS